MDFNLSSSHDETANTSHFNMTTLHEEIKGNETKSKKAKIPFCPISEDTIYLEEPSVNLSVPSVNTCRFSSSPVSVDSWMVYSSNSSDDFCLSSNSVSSDDISSDVETREDKRARIAQAKKRSPKKKPIPSLNECAISNIVDIRLIDFAHTTFANSGSVGKSERALPQFVPNTTIHYGPDCGFLTGIDSLQRLLSEILDDIEHNT